MCPDLFAKYRRHFRATCFSFSLRSTVRRSQVSFFFPNSVRLQTSFFPSPLPCRRDVFRKAPIYTRKHTLYEKCNRTSDELVEKKTAVSASGGSDIPSGDGKQRIMTGGIERSRTIILIYGCPWTVRELPADCTIITCALRHSLISIDWPTDPFNYATQCFRFTRYLIFFFLRDAKKKRFLATILVGLYPEIE